MLITSERYLNERPRTSLPHQGDVAGKIQCRRGNPPDVIYHSDKSEDERTKPKTSSCRHGSGEPIIDFPFCISK